jgi:hypothetical protein
MQSIMIPTTFTRQMVYSVGSKDDRYRRFVCLFVLVSALAAIYGCAGSASGSTEILTTKQAKDVLVQLTYDYEFRRVTLPEGASGALAGRMVGKKAVVNFGVSLGRHPEGVPVPKAGAEEAYGYPRGGFVFTDDLLVPGRHGHWHRPARFRTKAQWNEAVSMVVDMQEQLCKAATGEACPP